MILYRSCLVCGRTIRTGWRCSGVLSCPVCGGPLYPTLRQTQHPAGMERPYRVILKKKS